MWKHTYYVKILLALFLYLAPVSLVSCSLKPNQQKPEDKSKNPLESCKQLQNAQTSKSKLSQEVDINDIIIATDNLEKSLNTFIQQIDRTSKKTNQNTTHSENIINVNKDLETLCKELLEYSAVKSNEPSKKSLEALSETIENIQIKTDSLNNGLGENAEITVQKNPKDKQNILPGSDTTKNISDDLRKSRNLLKEHLQELINSHIINSNLKLNNRLEQNFNYINWFYFITIVINLIIFGLYLQLNRKYSFISKPNNTAKQIRRRNSTTSNNQISSVSSEITQQQNNEVSNKEELSNSVNDAKFEEQLYNLQEYFDSELRKLKSKIQTIEKKSIKSTSNFQQDNSFTPNYTQKAHSTDVFTNSEPPNQSSQPIPPVSQPDSSAKLKLVTTYNDNPDSLISKVIEVNITKESLENQRLGSKQYTILEYNSGGSYWISKEDNFHYLLPRKNFRINQHNISTVEALFECHNYQASSKQFNLIKPAKVTSIYGDKWQLEEMGILQFY